MDEEYTSLREEIMKWQDRRIIFDQLSLTLITAYTGYMISKDVLDKTSLSWQLVSILPLTILSMTMNVTKLFEQFHLRASSYLAVFYESRWEKNVVKLSLSKGPFRFGYNKSMAVVYGLLTFSSIFVFFEKYPTSLLLWQTLLFCVCFIVFCYAFVKLFIFKSSEEKKELFDQWTLIKNDLENTDVTTEAPVA